MTSDLPAFVADALAAPVDAHVAALAERLGRSAGAEAVLFYGSNLRSGALDGVLDFYVLTPGGPERGIWPTVSYHETLIGDILLRAKVATMRAATFTRAAAGATLDTTIWTRFAQPAALVWAGDEAARARVTAAVAAACATAARYAAVLGPSQGSPEDFWRALFGATYAAEFRVERSGRHEQFVARDADHYASLLPLAWKAAGITYACADGEVRPHLAAPMRARERRGWRVRQALGRPINVARLIRAAFTFERAARYGAWKIERHTGVHVALTPWRERHPVLAAPGVLWRVWRTGPKEIGRKEPSRTETERDGRP